MGPGTQWTVMGGVEPPWEQVSHLVITPYAGVDLPWALTCSLLAACCLLLAAYCLLLVACCLLLAACCMLLDA